MPASRQRCQGAGVNPCARAFLGRAPEQIFSRPGGHFAISGTSAEEVPWWGNRIKARPVWTVPIFPFLGAVSIPFPLVCKKPSCPPV